MTPRRLTLAHLPTPLWRSDALDALVGTEVWVKRDDMTAGAEAGNKIRKLEYLLADALDRGAKRVLTCGGVQSNHARATALLARSVGLDCTLFLRASDPNALQPLTGNLLLDRMAGADVRFITPAEYGKRGALLAAEVERLGREGERAYAIPEGGSNGLGALGYVDAMREVKEQLDRDLAGGRAFDALAIACGSGGSAAGALLGAKLHGVAERVLAVCVCDDRAYFDGVIRRIADEARAIDALLPSESECTRRLEIEDGYKGPAYGVASDEQKAFIVDVGQRTGLILDPVYTGKALFALTKRAPKPRRVLFVHTGGLPGLLAQADELAAAL